MAGPDPYLAGVTEIVLHATQEGSARVNRFHFTHGSVSPPTVPQLLEVATNFWTAINVPYSTLANANVNFDSVTARNIDSVGGAEATYTIPQPHPGLGSGGALPGNAAAVISWRTGSSGRFARGRTFLFGIGDNQATGSVLNGAYLSAAATLATAIKTFSNSGGAVSFQFVIASLTREISTAVLAYIIDSAVDSMRRRLIGRGR